MAQPDGTLKYDTLIDSNGFKSGLAKISNLAKTALQGAATLLASATAALSAGANHLRLFQYKYSQPTTLHRSTVPPYQIRRSFQPRPAQDTALARILFEQL